MNNLLRKAKAASYQFAATSIELRKKILLEIATLLETETDLVLTENKKDLDKMESTDPLYDRLLLNKERLAGIAGGCRQIAAMDDVIGMTLETKVLENGLEMTKKSVAMGVVGCIYEARPNVTVDIAALCIFSGNCVILRGSSNAEASNAVLIGLIHSALQKNDITVDVVAKFSTDRAEMPILLQATEYVDLVIPRGGRGLIDFVRREAMVPTIETGAGVCHTYVDTSADIDMAVGIVVNAKTQRPSVCNALDTLLIQEGVNNEFYQKLMPKLAEFKVEIFADKAASEKMQGYSNLKPSVEETWGQEFLGYGMGIRTVANIDEAINHINAYGSTHSEAIVSEDGEAVDKFFQLVDASSLYHNASTRFTDGEVFGLGAEVGISTQKLHARGPMGASALTTYKYILRGHGETRG